MFKIKYELSRNLIDKLEQVFLKLEFIQYRLYCIKLKVLLLIIYKNK